MEKRAICRREKCVFVTWFVVLVLTSHAAKASLPFCSSAFNVEINSPCRFSPGEHKYVSLDVRSDVFLESSSSNSKHLFIISGNFTIRTTAVLSVGYNYHANAGAAPGNAGGSYGGRGGAESGMMLQANQGVPYGSSLLVNTPGSKGGNGGQGGGLLNIHASAVTVDGSIRINGEHGTSNRKSGGGSGGGLAIQCTTFAGVGDLQVRGGLGRNYGGGGSGGRISVNCSNDAFLGTFHLQGGKTGEQKAFLYENT